MEVTNSMSMRTHRHTYLLVILTIVGFLYRLWFGSFAESRIIFDMSAYHNVAIRMANGELVAECCLRNNGYSFFLFPIYALFGSDNLHAIHIIQSILDILSGVFIYLIAKKQFGLSSAFLSYAIYLGNPFTTSYTGLRLGEVVVLFSVTSLTFVITKSDFSHRMIYWLIFGLLLGWLVFLKQSLYYFTIIVSICFCLLVMKRLKKFAFAFCVFVGFIITSLYTIIGNYTYFRNLHVVPPYNIAGPALYASFYLPRWPEIDAHYDEFKSFPKEYIQTMNEYNKAPLEEKPFVDKKYKALFYEKLKTDWPIFVQNTGRNMMLLWDKEHLFYYHDPFYSRDIWPLRALNSIFILFFLLGFSYYTKKLGKHALQNPLFLFSTLLFFYVTFFFTLINNESRFSLYFYPILFLFAGHGIDRLLHKK